MKIHNLLIAAGLLILGLNASAQYVTIPDKNFAHYLDTIIPSAMAGNQMDTTNPSVTTLKTINIENKLINNLSGVQYFTSLQRLDFGNGDTSIDSNKVVSLPILPATLDTLICGNNMIDTLPSLPSGLILLKCYGNKLTQLPALPATLIELYCYTNQLDSLPALPGSLKYLNCYNNQLKSLPKLPSALSQLICNVNQIDSLPVLPVPLNTLYCGNNLLKQLPILPNALSTLSCPYNQITSLGMLPNNLVMLDCTGNQLTSLPNLPNSLIILWCGQNSLNNQLNLPGQLAYLDCTADQLTSLPFLPGTLKTLACSNNNFPAINYLPPGLTSLICYNDQLYSLPASLPTGLTQLWCANNNISCFPIFPQTLSDTLLFDISGNPFNCLPNYVHGMDKVTLAYQLCPVGNSHGCPPAQGIVGYTYKDNNSNCTKDSGDLALQNIPVMLYNNTNTLTNQTYTFYNGIYDFPDTTGAYTVQVDTVGMPYMVQCTHPGADSVLFLQGIDTAVNFSLTCKPGFDVGVQSVVSSGLVFPGFKHNLNIIAGDMSQWYNLSCASGDSGTVQIDLSGPVKLAGFALGAIAPSLYNTNTLIYHIADFGAINNLTAFQLLINTDTTAKAGDQVCVTVTVTPGADNNPSNNTYQYCYPVRNSHDPNLKTVYPVKVLGGYDDWFTYTIQFQNTGTAAAQNIYIADTLDPQLDASTLQVINYSFPNTVHVINHLLSASFRGINLSDSMSDPINSIGFIQYRIKPKMSYPVGTTIKNTGCIYFDNNPAVVTNTAVSEYVIPESVTEITEQSGATIYPNPNNGEFTIQSSGLSDKSLVEIYNMMGQKVYSAAIHSGNTQISLQGKTTGVYLYRITTENGKLVSSGKVIIE